MKRLIVLLLFAVPLLAEPPRAEIERLNREMTAALNRGDGLAVAAVYADAARIVGPKRQTVEGREAINAYWSRIKNAKWTLEVREVGGTKDDAYQTGVSTLTSERGSYTCDFVLIWKRDASGKLRIHLDLYN
ncbi:MAG TPA: DUF4440 domain-containing protein [Thermoanaerobaculia bacterium]|nr:DUF4440 domain-containing protein [Thermoanaerobaculia bacterium]